MTKHDMTSFVLIKLRANYSWDTPEVCGMAWISRFQEGVFIADEANHFFTKFNEHDFSPELESVHSTLSLSESNGNLAPQKQSPLMRSAPSWGGSGANMAPGPDGVLPYALKVWADQFSDVLQFIFFQSLSQSMIALRWKTSWIVLVSKKNKCSGTSGM